MSKIVRFKMPQDELVKALEQLVEQAQNGEITGFVFSAKCPDGNVGMWPLAGQKLISAREISS